MTAAIHDFTLVVHHIPGAQLQDTADALSRQHLGGQFKERVRRLVDEEGVHLVKLPRRHFSLSSYI